MSNYRLEYVNRQEAHTGKVTPCLHVIIDGNGMTETVDTFIPFDDLEQAMRDTPGHCRVSGCEQESQHNCSVCGIDLCEEHTEADTVPYPFVCYCEQHYEEWKQSLEDGKVGEAGAVYAFMGWLTSRKPVSGPFSSHHEASQAAELVNTFCKMQGWEITDDYWHRHIKPYVEEEA